MINFKKQIAEWLINKVGVNVKDDYVPSPYGEGYVGTEISGGAFNEEQNPKLCGKEAARIYDKMRRVDTQVSSLLKLVKNPIKSGNFYFDPKDINDKEQKKRAEFLNHVFFEDMNDPITGKARSKTQLVKDLLTFLDFGFYLGEPVFKVVQEHPAFGTYIGLKDIIHIHPKSIEEWNLNNDGSINHIKQYLEGDNTQEDIVKIDGKNLIVISNDREGDNYEGISLLRPMYGEFLQKEAARIASLMIMDKARKTPIIVSVDTMLADHKYDKKMLSELQHRAAQIAAGRIDAFVFAKGKLKVDQIKVDLKTAEFKQKIEGHNTNMSKAVLGVFMEQGIGNNAGARAVGSDLMDLFLNGLHCLTSEACDQLQPLVKQIYDMRYNDNLPCPKLKHSFANNYKDELADLVKTMVDSGSLTPDDTLEGYLRKNYNLPEIDKETSRKVQKVEVDNDEQEPEKKKLSQFSDNYNNYIIQCRDGVKNTIKKTGKELHKVIADNLTEISLSYVDDLIKSLNNKKQNQWRKALEGVKPKGSILQKNILTELTLISTKSVDLVYRELGLTRSEKLNDITDKEVARILANLSPALRSRVKKEAELITAKQLTDLVQAIQFVTNTAVDKYQEATFVVNAIEQARESHIEKIASRVAIGGNAVSSIVNAARDDTFTKKSVFSEIESFIYTNPSPVSKICKMFAGRVIKASDYSTFQYRPPNHHLCDSIMVANRSGKKGNPEISPLGTDFVGSAEEVAAAKKSATF